MPGSLSSPYFSELPAKTCGKPNIREDICKMASTSFSRRCPAFHLRAHHHMTVLGLGVSHLL